MAELVEKVVEPDDSQSQLEKLKQTNNIEDLFKEGFVVIKESITEVLEHTVALENKIKQSEIE